MSVFFHGIPKKASNIQFINKVYALFLGMLTLLYTICCNIPYYTLIFPHDSSSFYYAILFSFVCTSALFHIILYYHFIYYITIPLIGITSSIILYFSLTYGYIQNREMFSLIFNTNISEVHGILSYKILFYIIPGFIISLIAIKIRNKINKPSFLFFISTFVILIVAYSGLALLAPRGMNGKDPMPKGYISHFSLAIKEHFRMEHMMNARTPLPGNVQYTPGKVPLIIVIALGDALRADHLSWYGYSRKTNPFTLPDIPLLHFSTVYSAGSGTLESVTRILTRATISNTTPAQTEQTFISLFRRAGFRTVWLTNQGSMAGAETPITSMAREADIYRTHPHVYQSGVKLMDSDLLPMLDEVLALPPQDTLIILHTYGSHFHPEDRYDKPFRLFEPVCENMSVADCDEKNLTNSYDNSIVATDHYWAALVDRLKTKNSLLLITADHGLRLHGQYKGSDSFRQDSPALRSVPLMLYASPHLINSNKIKVAQTFQQIPISHDIIFHSLLGFANIATPAYQPELDIFSGQLVPYSDPFVSLPADSDE